MFVMTQPIKDEQRAAEGAAASNSEIGRGSRSSAWRAGNTASSGTHGRPAKRVCPVTPRGECAPPPRRRPPRSSNFPGSGPDQSRHSVHPRGPNMNRLQPSVSSAPGGALVPVVIQQTRVPNVREISSSYRNINASRLTISRAYYYRKNWRP
ncbi:PREDICTED: uncharacterized protein LOC105359780 isoform X2 [Ceratosolen solmsi marchali]|uniref:Uncharacterized protein LOC105359780 isoform X2 n=1 Tax=Ceratosolen solmsi marchali TaxID=326594 RepID=A0AAJ6YCA9_9HYME|nr:PREDICTED: uncharacterized protein LOC105359780 isoform X2 [Ceratosolen solmsi marchali]